MPRALILLLSVLLVAGCGSSDVSDPSKPQRRLLTSGTASAGEPAAMTDPATEAAEAPARTAPEPAQPPEDFVREFFKTYLDSLGDTPWFENRELLSTWFSPDLTRLLLQNNAACQKNPDEACSLDFDPILDAQDNDDDVYSTLRTERLGTGTPVRVTVRFINLGGKVTMTYTLIQVDDSWRISDIQSPNYGSLSQFLASGEPAV